MDISLRQFPSLDNPNTLLYLGTSMNPTLEDLDLIQFSPYQKTPLQKGDVVVILRSTAPNHLVIHRIVSVSPTGIRTQGDNCNMIDPWVLMPSEILGYVTSIQRKNQKIRIDRGPSGYQKFLCWRIKKAIFHSYRNIAKYPYTCLCVLRVPARMISPFLPFRIVTFSGSNRSETQMFLGPLCVGRLQKGAKKWELKPFYRIFIDPSLLPSPEGEENHIIGAPSE